MKITLRKIGLIMGLVGLSGTLLAQAIPGAWEDVILEERGDTVVVKPSSVAPGYLNTMFFAIMGDTVSGGRKNLNRVYETVRGGTYIYDASAKIDETVPKVIIWSPPGTDLPALHIKTLNPEGKLKKGMFDIRGPESFYMENQYINMALVDDTKDRKFFNKIADSTRIEFKNCYIETSNWAWISMTGFGGTIKVTDCLIQNIGGEASVEKGNIYDGKIPFDTMWFENTTMLNCGNFMLTRDGASPNFVYFNHNTVINHINNPFLIYSQPEQIVTNNIFMNTGIVPDYPGFYPFFEDADKLPKGIINVDTVDQVWKDNPDFWNGNYPLAEADRKFLVDRNSASWDARFTDMFNDSLTPPSGDTVWASQMMTMNSRTQAMFDDAAAYPYFNEGHWYTSEPNFVNNEDMVPKWVSFIVTNAIPGRPNGGDLQPNWRTNQPTGLVQVDWPVLPDLSYTDGELASGGVNGYPLGDLNWFPSEKLSWEATNESETLIAALKAGDLPDWPVGIDNQRMVRENIPPQVSAYPNPFSNTTTVRYEIASNTDVQLIVYNVLGERVRVMELGYKSTGTHEATLDRGGLDAGMYILQINTNYNKAGLTTKISIKQ